MPAAARVVIVCNVCLFSNVLTMIVRVKYSSQPYMVHIPSCMLDFHLSYRPRIMGDI